MGQLEFLEEVFSSVMCLIIKLCFVKYDFSSIYFFIKVTRVKNSTPFFAALTFIGATVKIKGLY